MLIEWRDRLASGDVSAREAVDEWLHRLETVNQSTNCIAYCDAERALAAAAALDDTYACGGVVGPLHGVPFTVKDWIDVEGLPCTGGFVDARDRRPAADATVVRRLRTAGAVVLAKTAVQVESELFGAVRNPHRPQHSAGASSSGEAAAVGGRGSLFGLASDSGGSIRVPAAWCGAAGLKPTAGLVPVTGHFPRVGDRGDGRTQIAPLAMSVPDLAFLLPLLAGPDDIDPGVPPITLEESSDAGLIGLRVARAASVDDWRCDDEVGEAVDAAVTAFVDRGATQVDDIDLRLSDCFDITQRYWDRSRLSGAEADRQLRDWDHYRWSMARARRDIDVIVMPTTAGCAPLHRPMETADYGFTLPASLTGWPALNVPLRRDGQLPLGVQLVARSWQDDVALAAGALLEHVWAG